MTRGEIEACGALVKAYPAGLTSQQLKGLAPGADPAKALRTAKDKLPPVISLPGTPIRGRPGLYRILPGTNHAA